MGALTRSMCLGISALRMPSVAQQLSLEGRHRGIQTCGYHTAGSPIVHQLGVPHCCPEGFLCTHYSPSQALSCVISDIPEVTIPYLSIESPGADEGRLHR